MKIRYLNKSRFSVNKNIHEYDLFDWSSEFDHIISNDYLDIIDYSLFGFDEVESMNKTWNFNQKSSNPKSIVTQKYDILREFMSLKTDRICMQKMAWSPNKNAICKKISSDNFDDKTAKPKPEAPEANVAKSRESIIPASTSIKRPMWKDDFASYGLESVVELTHISNGKFRKNLHFSQVFINFNTIYISILSKNAINQTRFMNCNFGLLLNWIKN